MAGFLGEMKRSHFQLYFFPNVFDYAEWSDERFFQAFLGSSSRGPIISLSFYFIPRIVITVDSARVSKG